MFKMLTGDTDVTAGNAFIGKRRCGVACQAALHISHALHHLINFIVAL